MKKALFPLALFLWSCALAPGNFRSTQSSDLAARNIRRIAIVPAEPGAPEEARLSSPAAVLNNQLYSAMSALPQWQIIPERKVREAVQTASRDGGGGGARRLGDLVDADAVLSGRVLHYRERVGED